MKYFNTILLIIVIAFGLTVHHAVMFKAPDGDATMDYAEAFIEVDPFVSKTSAYEVIRQDGVYHVYFSNTIVKDTYYKKLIRALRTMPAGTQVVFHLTNYGGSVHTGVQIINAMNASQAHIHIEAEAPNYSMGALIACAGDSLNLNPYAFLMFHDYSGSFTGKGSESREIINALDVMLRNMVTKECVAKGILTAEQVDKIFDGTDVYVHPHMIKSSSTAGVSKILKSNTGG